MDWKALRESLIGERKKSVLPPKIPLPMLPHAVLEFNRKAEDPNVPHPVLAKIIETDTGLTTELLRYVNSASFGLRAKASTAQQAISLLGIRPTKLFLLSAGVQSAMKATKSKLINIQNFWLSNLERALFAREVARRLRANVDVAFAGSMMHDFLLPLLANELFADYLRFAETPEHVRRPLADFERDAFGWDHPLATAQVLMGWDFPDDLVCCVLLHHGGLAILSDPELGRTAPAAVAVAALIPDALRQSGDSLPKLLQLNEIWPDLQLMETAATVAQQLAALTTLGQQHITLARRLEKLHLAAGAAPQA